MRQSQLRASFAWILVLALLGAERAWSRDFALVLAGFGRLGETKTHDFAMPSAAASLCLRQAGYEVRHLAGPQNPDDPQAMDGSKVFPEDYAFLREQKLGHTPATLANIDAQMRGLVADVKKARAAGEDVNVEIVVNAHGRTWCAKDLSGFGKTSGKPGGGSAGGGSPGGFDPGGPPGTLPPGPGGLPPGWGQAEKRECRHVIEVFDGQKVVLMESRQLKAAVAEMEKAGAHVNLNLNSCNAGASKDDFDGLKGVCTFYGTAEESFATGCHKKMAEDIKDGWWNSNTYVNMFRACGGRFADLKKPEFKGYFSQDACFQGLEAHLERNKIDLTSVASAYFGERRQSTSFEASLLSCFDLKHLNESDIGTAIYQRKEMCRPSADENLKKLLEGIEPARQALVREAFNVYDRAIESYNASIQKQYEILPIDGSADSLSADDARRLAEIQKETKRLSDELIAKERVLFDRIREAVPEKFKGCEQGPCARPLGGAQ